MERLPAEPQDKLFRRLLEKTLENIDLVESQEGAEPFFAAMPGGMTEVNSITARKTRQELIEIWGKTYPDVFDRP